MLLSFTACTSKETVNTENVTTASVITGIETVSTVESTTSETETEVSIEESETEATTVVNSSEVAETVAMMFTDEEVTDIRNITQSLWTMFAFSTLDITEDMYNSYCDITSVIDEGKYDATQKQDAWKYVAIKTDFAASKEDLYNKVRMCFTENFVADDSLKTFFI